MVTRRLWICSFYERCGWKGYGIGNSILPYLVFVDDVERLLDLVQQLAQNLLNGKRGYGR